ncbi:B12-binding domain-containing radical SAM protein [Anabaena sp. UHCC 0204]|uniref:B12-binding domain-containing radical SAM protein n=1 Tax=Anabaena sp. UHCC 0204 TaxID=2590009 RepID=UPI001446DB73|nr:radical SAM protein [Anabaena sp. UHCC 0204]MTJ10092.1 radical SAM protein [Anabaena sp. UHCC 0204]
MSVLVINSPLFREKKLDYTDNYLPPLGLGYIATSIKLAGFSVELVDSVSKNLSIKEIVNLINSNLPKFVVMNVFSTNLLLVKDILSLSDSSIHFILGGGTKYLCEEILSWEIKNNITIIKGEGDFIVSAIISGENINNFSHDSKKIIQITAKSQYFPHDISRITIDHTFFENEPLKHQLGFNEAYISTSRGCIYNCAFCGSAIALNLEEPRRERSIKSVIEEISQLCSLYPQLEVIRILDDLFLVNKESVDRAYVIFERFSLAWRAMAHIKSISNLDEGEIRKLKFSGCQELFFGIESGSTKIQELIHKINKPSVIKNTFEKLFRFGINVKAFFIFGFPNETEYDMQCTYDLACEIKELSNHFPDINFRTSVFQFRPYHGTELFNQLKMIDSNVCPIKQNKNLSHKIGRHQFNFASQNFSDVSDDFLETMISKTIQLSF